MSASLLQKAPTQADVNAADAAVEASCGKSCEQYDDTKCVGARKAHDKLYKDLLGQLKEWLAVAAVFEGPTAAPSQAPTKAPTSTPTTAVPTPSPTSASTLSGNEWSEAKTWLTPTQKRMCGKELCGRKFSGKCLETITTVEECLAVAVQNGKKDTGSPVSSKDYPPGCFMFDSNLHGMGQGDVYRFNSDLTSPVNCSSRSGGKWCVCKAPIMQTSGHCANPINTAEECLSVAVQDGFTNIHTSMNVKRYPPGCIMFRSTAYYPTGEYIGNGEYRFNADLTSTTEFVGRLQEGAWGICKNAPSTDGGPKVLQMP